MPNISGGQGLLIKNDKSSMLTPTDVTYFHKRCFSSSFPHSRSKDSHRLKFSNSAWYLSLGVLCVLPRSSVCTSFALGFILRIASIAKTVPLHSATSMLRKSRGVAL